MTEFKVKGDDDYGDYISIEYSKYHNKVEVYSDDGFSPISSTTVFDKEGLDRLIDALKKAKEFIV